MHFLYETVGFSFLGFLGTLPTLYEEYVVFTCDGVECNTVNFMRLFITFQHILGSGSGRLLPPPTRLSPAWFPSRCPGLWHACNIESRAVVRVLCSPWLPEAYLLINFMVGLVWIAVTVVCLLKQWRCKRLRFEGCSLYGPIYEVWIRRRSLDSEASAYLVPSTTKHIISKPLTDRTRRCNSVVFVELTQVLPFIYHCFFNGILAFTFCASYNRLSNGKMLVRRRLNLMYNVSGAGVQHFK